MKRASKGSIGRMSLANGQSKIPKFNAAGPSGLNLHTRRPSSGCSSLGLGRVSMGSMTMNLCDIKKDTRSLFDKGVQQKEAKNLLEFLESRRYPHAISLKTLLAPQAKDLANIFEFMYKILDPSFTIKKIDDDFLGIFKSMGYPFQFSRSHFLTTGSSHSWPHILGALDWLRQLLEYSIELNWENQISVLDYEMHSEIHIEYGMKSYHALMDGTEDFTEMDEEFKQTLVNKDLKEFEELREELEEANRKIAELEAESADVQEDVRMYQAMQNDERNFGEFLIKTNSHYAEKMEEVEVLDEEIEELKRCLKVAEEEKNDLQKQIDMQEMSAEEYEKLLTSIAELKKQDTYLFKESDELKHQISKFDVEITNVWKEVEDRRSEYNKLCYKCQMVPATSANANGCDYELRISPDKMDEDVDLLKINIEKKFKELQGELHASTVQHRNEEERYEKAKEYYEEQQSKLKVVQGNIQKSKEALTDKSKETVKEIESYDSAMATVEETLKKWQQNRKEQLERMPMKKEAARKLREKKKAALEDHAETKQVGQEYFKKHCDAALGFRHRVEEEIIKPFNEQCKLFRETLQEFKK